MIRQYLIEKRSWILLFVLIHLFIMTVAYFDTTIPLQSIIYLVFLSFIIFIIFVIFRYHKETKFYKSLNVWDNTLELSSIATPSSPFESIVVHSVLNQTQNLKQSASLHQLSLEQEKDELLSWIHEVKTPLTAMSLMIDRLEDESIKSDLIYEWLRIHLLLDQQLHQKRILFIENDLYIEQTNLKPLITREIKDLQSWCMQKGIGFELNLDVTSVLTDAKWLAFIIRQLLTNAIKYSEDSDIMITSYEKFEQSFVEIKDFGRGIESKDLPRIFEKGFTSTAKHKDNAATGMGLYLANKAAAPLLIQITVHSELNVGTSFTLQFPKRNQFNQLTGM